MSLTQKALLAALNNGTKIKATFVSVWDDYQEISSNCKVNPKTGIVSDIATAKGDHGDLDILIEEKIEFVTLVNGEPRMLSLYVERDDTDDEFRLTLSGMKILLESAGVEGETLDIKLDAYEQIISGFHEPEDYFSFDAVVSSQAEAPRNRMHL